MKEKSTIALVDDERHILSSLRTALEAEGFKDAKLAPWAGVRGAALHTAVAPAHEPATQPTSASICLPGARQSQ